ncbi:MAG: hypothetical protein D6770_07595 [Anaerolineae bacterium]|nr:MAG: hypothetical protein D6770_07595 [Anaerolineae bacterium]
MTVNVQASPTTVYYGACSGQPTVVQVQARVSGVSQSQIAGVRLIREYYRGQYALDVPQNAPMMWDAQAQAFVGWVDVQQPNEADIRLNGQKGRVEVTVNVSLKDGRYVASKPIPVNVEPCTTLGPPIPPPSVMIQAVNTNPDVSYYGNCQSGETTWVYIEVVVDNIEAVSSATLRYEYGSGTVSPMGYSRSAPMYRAQGIGNYTAFLDFEQELTANDSFDWVEYVVDITTIDGQTISSQPQTYSLTKCYAAPANPPQILYFYALNDNDQVMEGSAIVLRWETENATCGVFLNGDAVNEDEPNEYSPTVAPFGMVGETLTFTLQAWGGDCTNPVVEQQSVTLTITAQNTGDPPQILYFYALNDNNEVMEGSAVVLAWETEYAICGVFLNGEAVNEDEPNEYSPTVAPFGMVGETLTFTLEARGGDCTNPLVEQQSITLTIISQDG